MELAEKYKNCCRFCFKEVQKPYLGLLGDGDFTDVPLIQSLMGIPLEKDNDIYSEVLPKNLCLSCSGQVIGFINYRNKSQENYLAFEKEYETAQRKRKKYYYCPHCTGLTKFDSEDSLNQHLEGCHKDNSNVEETPMEIDTSCNSQEIIQPIQNGIATDQKEEICNIDIKICGFCDRKFPANDEKNMYARHLIFVHPKKEKCLFCGKTFKNRLYLSNHIYEHHLEENGTAEKITNHVLTIPKPFVGIKKEEEKNLL